MRFPILLLTLLPSAFCVVPIPKGTTSAAINLSPSELRVYHQDNSLGSGIKEITVNVPTSPVTNDGYFYFGQTRRNTPLAAVTWKPAGASQPEIRVYYITTSNTLGEVAYSTNGWNGGGDLGFSVQADSSVLYALKAGDILVVGYANGEGNLSEAYYNVSSGGGWKGYVL